jgi:ferredoxin
MANTNIAMKIDLENYLSNQYASYLDRVNALALAKPNDYFKYREEVSKHIKTEAIKNLYNTLYNALRYGCKSVVGTGAKGVRISTQLPLGEGEVDDVHMSDTVINEKCISCATALNTFLDEIINDICPVQASEMSQARLRQMGNIRA